MVNMLTAKRLRSHKMVGEKVKKSSHLGKQLSNNVELRILELPCENCTFVEECPFWGPVVMLLLWDLVVATAA
jgi:hypothetical protein